MPASDTVRCFNYSDGDEIEARLLEALKECKDISVASTELLRHITDWPSKYHFSPTRHNLLRQIPLHEGTQVLELGCGCGAMTRYLGERGAKVVAVDGSARRAEIAAQRCRDLANVSIVCDNLMDFAQDRRFDVVTLIGVLEYAPRYISGDDPIKACLKQAASFLKPDGVLVIAIENQLGLKYFNGCDEDHIGKPYYGLHGLYRPDEPTTLGRTALIEKLGVAGLRQQRFFYPFPDYKLPQVLLSDTALAMPNFDVAALLSRMASGNAGGAFHPNFHENLAWRPIIENGLLPHLANSFLVVAGHHGAALDAFDPTFLAAAYTPDRLPRYATETIFRKTAHGAIAVEKKPLFHDKAMDSSLPTIAEGELVHHVGTVSNYVPGTLYVVELQRRLARGESLDAVIDWASDWLELIKTSLTEDSTRLPGHWLDMIPQNLIRTTDGKLESIDAEWAISQSIPISWVIFRGLMYALAVCPTSPALSGISLLETLRRISASQGIRLDDVSIQQACTLEAELRIIVYGEKREVAEQRLLQHLSMPPHEGINVPTLRETCEAKCIALESEIYRVKSTVSWQITKPLRALWNIPRRCIAGIFRRQQRQ